MQNRFWRMNDWQQRRFCATQSASLKRRARRRFGLLLLGVTLLALALLLSACTTPPQQPCETPQFPTQPALSEPLPLETYSEQWRLLAEAWRKKLIGTP